MPPGSHFFSPGQANLLWPPLAASLILQRTSHLAQIWVLLLQVVLSCGLFLASVAPILTWTNVPTPSVFLLVLLLYLTRWRQAGCIWRGYSGAAYRFFFYTSCRWYYETWMFLNSCLPQWTPSKGMYGKYRTLIIWPHRGGNPSVMSSLYPTSQERPPQCYLLYTRPYRGNLGVKSALYPASQEATSV